MNEESHNRLIEKMKRELGKNIMDVMYDPTVVEIMLNQDGVVRVERLGSGMEIIGHMSAAQADNLISTIATLANAEVNAKTPILECQLPIAGERFEALIPPSVKAPIFAMRKRATKIFTLEEYVAAGIVSQEIADSLKQSVEDRENILVVGGAGSGKTTLGNALLHHLGMVAGEEQRLVLIEEVPELQCSAPNAVFLQVSEGADANRLLRATMRLRPDRIIVGEVRGPEALSLLKAWNTGHPGGICTIHANNPELALVRLDQLCQEAGVPSQEILIREAVDAIVFIEKTKEGSRAIRRLWRPKIDA
jgi:type IV secretion system protein VirB11